MTTIVPKTIAFTTFFFGFSISPDMKVTFSHATELKTEPTIAAAIPPKSVIPPIDFQPEGAKLFPSSVPKSWKAFQPKLIFSAH